MKALSICEGGHTLLIVETSIARSAVSERIRIARCHEQPPRFHQKYIRIPSQVEDSQSHGEISAARRVYVAIFDIDHRVGSPRRDTLQFSAVHRSQREFRVGVGADLRSPPDLEARPAAKLIAAKRSVPGVRGGSRTGGNAKRGDGREAASMTAGGKKERGKTGGMEATIKTE